MVRKGQMCGTEKGGILGADCVHYPLFGVAAYILSALAIPP
jgi:hypothetical protein